MNNLFVGKEDIYIKITFYPKYINSISSYHKITNNEYYEFSDFVNNNLFIENFFRTSKNGYDSLSKDNLEYEVLKEIEFIKIYLDNFSNDFNLYEMITYFFKNDNLSDSISSMSDEDLQDSINIIKITNYSLNKQNEKITNIINKNPHLKDNSSLDDIILD